MLHWIIEARPATAEMGSEVEIDDHRLPALDVPANDRGQALAVTFDEVAQQLMASPGVYWEPDGSFAWTDAGPPRYRLQGQLADGGTHLQHVELWGQPSPHMLDRLLEFTHGGPLMFQLVRWGVYVDEAELRRILGCERGD